MQRRLGRTAAWKDGESILRSMGQWSLARIACRRRSGCVAVAGQPHCEGRPGSAHKGPAPQNREITTWNSTEPNRIQRRNPLPNRAAPINAAPVCEAQLVPTLSTGPATAKHSTQLNTNTQPKTPGAAAVAGHSWPGGRRWEHAPAARTQAGWARAQGQGAQWQRHARARGSLHARPPLGLPAGPRRQPARRATPAALLLHACAADTPLAPPRRPRRSRCC